MYRNGLSYLRVFNRVHGCQNKVRIEDAVPEEELLASGAFLKEYDKPYICGLAGIRFSQKIRDMLNSELAVSSLTDIVLCVNL